MAQMMSYAKPNFLQDMERKNLELQSKIDRTGIVTETPTFQIQPEKKVLNFGAPMSGPGITNFEEYKQNIPAQPTTQKSSGLNIIPTANASNGENKSDNPGIWQQLGQSAMETSLMNQPKIQNETTGRGPTNLFIQEREALENMLNAGIKEETALEAIKEKRKELWGNTQLSPQESQALILMAQANIDIKDAVKAVKEKRYDDANILQKIGKNVLDLASAGPALMTEQMANIGSFITGSDELKRQAQDIKKIRKEDFESTLGGKTGSFVTGLGEVMAVGPTKLAPTLLGRTAQGAMVGGVIGGATPVLEEGKDATLGDIALGGAVGGTIGAVATPLLEKVAIPAVGGLVNKGIKYTKATKGGGVEGLGKSISRDIKRPFNKIQTKGVAPQTAYSLSTKANRFNAKDIEDFKKITNESPGEFAVKRGMTKTGESAVEEATKNWQKSMQQADDALQKIQGDYKINKGTDYMGEMLEDLNGRLSKTLSKDSKRVQDLLNKYREKGLNMTEINEIKRLYSQNYKYNWLEAGSENALKSKNLQDGVRQWQFRTAEEQGLKNLNEINKNTQGWKAFADNLSKKLKRSEGNNNMSLTDWVALSGGDIGNIGLFLGKKAGSTQMAQQFLIKNLGKQTKEPIISPKFNQNDLTNNFLRNRTDSVTSGKIKALPEGRGENIYRGIGLPSKGSIKTPAPGMNKVTNTAGEASPPIIATKKQIALPPGKVITPQTAEKGIIQESKKGVNATIPTTSGPYTPQLNLKQLPPPKNPQGGVLLNRSEKLDKDKILLSQKGLENTKFKNSGKNTTQEKLNNLPKILKRVKDEIIKYGENIGDKLPDTAIDKIKQYLGKSNIVRFNIDIVSPKVKSVLKENNIEGVKGHSITSSGIQHILKGHGQLEKIGKNEIPVTINDIKLIPSIIKNPDSVKLSTKKSGEGRKVLIYEKKIGDKYYYLENIDNRSGYLSTQTMYINKE